MSFFERIAAGLWPVPDDAFERIATVTSKTLAELEAIDDCDLCAAWKRANAGRLEYRERLRIFVTLAGEKAPCGERAFRLADFPDFPNIRVCEKKILMGD